MSTQSRSRRAFLIESVSGLGGAWVAANYAGIMDAQSYVLQAAQSGQPARFAFFTPDRAIEVDAMAAQIIPTDETPGAREARVVYFIDRALVTLEKGRQADYTAGLATLASETKKLFPNASKFSALPAAEQVQVLTAMEKMPFSSWSGRTRAARPAA